MKKLTAKKFSSAMLFTALAVLAVALMGTTAANPRCSDLTATARQLINESSEPLKSQWQNWNVSHASAIIRANIAGN